jgi:hypothetical protein
MPGIEVDVIPSFQFACLATEYIGKLMKLKTLQLKLKEINKKGHPKQFILFRNDPDLDN